jgi:uncharacterized protein YbjT (DUF2867 family)
MRVLIIGASGSLAPYVIEAIKDKAEVTLFVRNKRRLLSALSSEFAVVEGDAANYQDVRAAVQGKDLVYVNLAGDLERMGNNIVKAMKETGVKRIVVISSIGIYDFPLKGVLVPYRKLADLVEASGLDYTILRPDWFTSADEVDYTITRKGAPETGTAISRKSIAAFVAEIVRHPELYKHENLGISKP